MVLQKNRLGKISVYELWSRTPDIMKYCVLICCKTNAEKLEIWSFFSRCLLQPEYTSSKYHRIPVGATYIIIRATDMTSLHAGRALDRVLLLFLTRRRPSSCPLGRREGVRPANYYYCPHTTLLCYARRRTRNSRV